MRSLPIITDVCFLGEMTLLVGVSNRAHDLNLPLKIY
jgi:hypothetical protein